MKQEENLEDRIFRLALEESVEVLAIGYKMVKNMENEFGYFTERRNYDACAKRFINMARDDWKDYLRKHYEEWKEK